jgi:hypothetical protein
MRPKRNIVERITKFLPGGHERYREMCSLAVIGQLGGPQMCELNEHVATCDPCRKFLESVGQASVQFLPVLAEDRISSADSMPPAGMRSRFLSRLAREADNRKKDALPATKGLETTTIHLEPRGEHTTSEEDSAEVEELVFQRVIPSKSEVARIRKEAKKSGRQRLVWIGTGAIAASAVIAASGFYWGRKTSVLNHPPAAAAIATPPAVVGTLKGFDDPVSVLQRDKGVLQSQLTDVRAQFAKAKADQDSLRAELAVANEKLASFGRTQTASQVLSSQRFQESKNEVAQLESEAERLQQRLADSDTKLALQRRTTEEVSQKLQVTEASLQEELSNKDAKSQMGELVAARNLHIVDVYDADPTGKRQRAFGRVFYTEGKSLVFYAYDLEDVHQAKVNVVFHVWGGKAGIKEVSHSLGILRKDDAGQARWAMTFDDPGVLAQINTVFVTAESGNKKLDEPHGKKVLYAYFGTQPNHP